MGGAGEVSENVKGELSMDMTLIADFIRPELLLVGVFLYALGLFLKLLPSFREEWAIPFILLGVSVVLCPVYMLVILHLQPVGEVVLSGAIQGVLLAALCVFANQMIKQAVNKRVVDGQASEG
jgi:hypothetical protein